MHSHRLAISAVLAAAVLAGGSPASSQTVVNQLREEALGTPATASNRDHAVAIWLALPAEQPPVEIRGRRLGPQGGPRGDEFVVSEHACGIAPDVAMAEDGSFVVASVECRADEPGRRLVVHRFNRWAEPIGQRLEIGRYDTRSLRIDVADDGSVAVAFSLQPVDGRQTLHLARLGTDGRSAGVTAVDAEPGSLYQSALEVDGLVLSDSGVAVILWHGLRAAESWVAVDAVDPDGFTRRWNLAECAIDDRPAACADAALGRWGDELIAVWSESRVAAEFSVDAQRLSTLGEPLGAPWAVLDGSGDDRLRGHLDVGRVASGSPFVLWAQRRDATSRASAVVGRPIGPDWPPQALLTIAAGPGARAPRVAMASDRGTVVVWLEGEGRETDLVAHLVRPLEPEAAPVTPVSVID